MKAFALILPMSALAVSACTYSTHGPAEHRSVESAGMVASKTVHVGGDAEFAGMFVRADGEVGDDLSLEGMSVRSNADVGGDLYAAGARIRFTGSVAGRARVEGALIHLDGQFGERLDVTGARMTIDGRVEGESRIHGARMELRARFEGPVTVIGEGTNDEGNGRAILSGYFAEPLTVCAAEIDIERSAHFAGGLTLITDDRVANLPGDAALEALNGRDCERVL